MEESVTHVTMNGYTRTCVMMNMVILEEYHGINKSYWFNFEKLYQFMLDSLGL